jgi:PAS domain S-box-containing protein
MQQSIRLLNDNAKKLSSEESLSKSPVAGSLAELDESIRNIKIQFNELRRKEQSAINQSLDVICMIGPDQVFQSVNPASLRVLGYPPYELIGRKFTDFVCEEDRDNSLNASLGAARSIDVLSFENRMMHRDGTIRHMLWSAHWSAAEKALFCVIHDHTERKIAEALLAENEARIRNIIEVLPVGLLVANRLGIVESANQTFLSISGTTANQVTAKHLQNFLPEIFKTAGPPDFGALLGSLTDTRLKLQSGEYASVQVSSSELMLGANKLFLIAVVDTTEKEKLEQVKREFFSMINHDLRAPLTSLLSVFDLMEDGSLGKLTDHGNEVIKRNSSEVNRLVKLVDELLDIEKMKAGKFDIEAEFCDTNSIVEVAINAIQLLAQRHKIKIAYSPVSLQVFGDRSLLIRTLVNLLSNAVKFSPSGSEVTIEVKETDEITSFAVIDSGIGITEDQKERIFEQYHQVKDRNKQGSKGSGLGLAICKMIVEQHGGRIWVDSKPGRGSSFCFSIPKKQL